MCSKPFYAPAIILRIEDRIKSFPAYTVHIWAVYGGNNGLYFRCPYCGAVHVHGAGCVGGDSDGVHPSPHCQLDQLHERSPKNFQWELHELIEGMDISLAGDLGKKAKEICPRRLGEAGYDQLENGRLAYRASTAKLIKSYKERGVKHG